ncbi:hypothetical protein FA15DRAFT_584052 [Coprinopsis marcescibilis]|uniref:Uncharacterized protein n=1 Tax=Coprinopsis marcescibilis TaxID=230819 RepID=A0A5C3L6Q8_COPMA|nr:hypothetical protein FA15DRAFT_584052 [Coprinopsis marcescibilis]
MGKPEIQKRILEGEQQGLVEEPEDAGEETEREEAHEPPKRLGRTASLRARLGSIGKGTKRKLSLRKRDKSKEGDNRPDTGATGGEATLDTTTQKKLRERTKGKEKALPPPPLTQPEVGFIPGRSFVGRVLECGWEVKEEVVRKGEWVSGLLDVRKSGALTEFIVVDRHRVHRVPHPSAVPGGAETNAVTTATTTSFNSFMTTSTTKPSPAIHPPSLTLEELALLALNGIPAYRAVRTFMQAFSGLAKPASGPKPFDYPPTTANGTFLGGRNHMMADHEPHRRRRALVLRGHDGVGAMAVQMLALRGWRVSVHVPLPGPHDAEESQQFMVEAEERVKLFGGEEVVFDDGGIGSDPWWDGGRLAAARVIDGLKEDGDVFDAVLDTIGGKEVREASERLLKSVGSLVPTTPGGGLIPLDGQTPRDRASKKSGPGQFTTLVGDVPERTIPTAADNFRAGLRSLKFGTGSSAGGGTAGSGSREGEEPRGKVGYAWISVAQDVDWEGEGISETIGNVLRLAFEHGIKPTVPRISTASASAAMYQWKGGAVPFDQAPEIFVDGDGPLCSGGTMVVKIASN